MLNEVEKRHRRAVELEQIWNKWFPSLSGQANVEFWMVALDNFMLTHLAEAIRRCARKRIHTPMTISQMKQFILDTAPLIENETGKFAIKSVKSGVTQ